MEKAFNEDSGGRSIDLVDLRSLKNRLFAAWDENPYLSARKVCEIFNLNYRKRRGTIKTYRSEWKKLRSYEGGSSASSLHARTFVVSVDNNLFNRENACEHGWSLKQNRNKSLAWLRNKNTLGWVDWGSRGKVVVRLRSGCNRGHLKQLFYYAFTHNELVNQSSIVDVAFDKLVEVRRHHVFSVHEKSSRFEINTFQKSHGIRAYRDGSHPHAIEVEETLPLGIAGRFNDLDGKMNYLLQGSMTTQQLARANLGLLQAMAKKDYARKAPKNEVDLKLKNGDQPKTLRGPLGVWQFPVFNTWMRHCKQNLK